MRVELFVELRYIGKLVAVNSTILKWHSSCFADLPPDFYIYLERT